jgi:drug/metabolite transporter (DMT)-like permease
VPRIAGLVVGFAGVVVLVSVTSGRRACTATWGQLAVLAASVCYATGITFSRRYVRGQPPVVRSFDAARRPRWSGWRCRWRRSRWTGRARHSPGSLLWLGLLGSCMAYLLFFGLIAA